MIDSEYSTNIHKSLNTSIGTVIRNPEMSKFVSDHLINKKQYVKLFRKMVEH